MVVLIELFVEVFLLIFVVGVVGLDFELIGLDWDCLVFMVMVVFFLVKFGEFSCGLDFYIIFVCKNL